LLKNTSRKKSPQDIRGIYHSPWRRVFCQTRRQ